MVCLCLGLSACAEVPRYDVPVDQNGAPTVNSIVRRVQCELVTLVRDASPDGPAYPYRKALLDGDYNVAISLSLDVTQSGSLAPSITAIFPFNLTIGGGAVLSKSRDQNFTQNLNFSLRGLYFGWVHGNVTDHCPDADTSLAGKLGLQDAVTMALGAEAVPGSGGAAGGGSSGAKSGASDSQFGGYVNFVLTRNVNSVGPTWSLQQFKGPGGLLGLSQVNTDKLTFAFAQGTPGSFSLKSPINPNSEAAQGLLKQLLTQQISDSLDR